MQTKSHQIRAQGRTLQELHDSVVKVFEDYDSMIIERAFALLHEVYRCVLLNQGGNQYSLPHSEIRKRQERGEPVIDLKVDWTTRGAGLEAMNAYFLDDEADVEDDGFAVEGDLFAEEGDVDEI